jgi:Tol biopolymer transport system component
VTTPKKAGLVVGLAMAAGLLVCATFTALAVIGNSPLFAKATPAPPATGERILFLSYQEGPFDHGPNSWEGATGHWRISVVRVDGNGRGEFAVEPEQASSGATWSPDGKKVLFSNANSIWAINADGSHPTRLSTPSSLSPTVTFLDFPIWSPDGRQIAYLAGASLHVSNADGSNDRGILQWIDVDMKLKHSAPSWSPNGKQIAVWTDEVPVDDRQVTLSTNAIILVNVDGSGYSRLTDNTSNNTFPSWSPNGQQIAFVSDRDGISEIYLMEADGSDPQRLTHHQSVLSPDQRGRQMEPRSLSSMLLIRPKVGRSIPWTFAVETRRTWLKVSIRRGRPTVSRLPSTADRQST